MAKTIADTISAETAQAPLSTKELFISDTVSEKKQAPIQLKNIPTVPEVKKVKRDSRIFLLTNDKRQGNVIIDLQEELYDPITKKTRAMRLIRRAPSIWLDEQPTSNFPSTYVEKNELTQMFQKGRAIIPITETQKLQAMELSNRNVDNPNKMGTKDFYFKEWNPEVENQKAIEEEDAVINAMQMAITAVYSEMLQHAAYLNIETIDEQGVEYDEQALRASYIRYAKNNTNKFLKSIHSPTVKVAYLIRNAINKGTIDLGLQMGAAYWSDGGFICILPEGRDATEYLIEYAQTFGDANAAFKIQLEENTA